MQLARGENYFHDPELAINVCKVNRMKGITHNNDLTEVEHHHDFIEIVFISKGRGMQVISNYEYEVAEGDIFILQGFQNHYFRDAGKAEIINVMFDPVKNPGLVSHGIRTMEGYNALFILEPGFRNRKKIRNMLHLNRVDLVKAEYILNHMLYEITHREPGYEISLRNKLEELIIFLSRKYSQITIPRAKSLIRIAKAVDFIDKHYPSGIYIQDLADLSYMSLRNFQRIFKESTGMSPNDYILDLRIKQACKLLTESDLAVYEVSGRVGIPDWYYFSRSFKHRMGMSPVNFRKNRNQD